MAKLCALLVLGLACAVSAVRFDPPSLVRTGKYFAEDLVPRTTIDDPICRQGNGLYPHPTDCTHYLACSEGSSQERECPEGFKFDTRRHCTPEEDADCGNMMRKVAYRRVAVSAVCPESYGQFPDLQDCHKFIVCVDGVAKPHTCPDGQHYHDNVGCVDGEACPRHEESEAAFVCPEEKGHFADPLDCHKFYMCVAYVPTSIRCLPGHHYESGRGCERGELCPQLAEAGGQCDLKIQNGIYNCTYGRDGTRCDISCSGKYQGQYHCLPGRGWVPSLPFCARPMGSSVCRKADGLYPHSNCLKFYKCVNFKPQSKECPRGKAFDPKKETCTREQFNNCKRNNDVQDILRA